MSVQDKMLKRIRGKGRGAVFSPKDFLDLGSRAAVDQSLSRLKRNGDIRRLGRGIYDYPQRHPRLGHLSPDTHEVAKTALGPSARLQMSGAQALNALGLSTQVPAKVVLYTNGPNRTVRLGSNVIQIKHASPQRLVGAGTVSGQVFQALRYLGRDRVDNDVVGTLRRKLPLSAKRQLARDAQKDAHLVPDWMRPVVNQITESP